MAVALDVQPTSSNFKMLAGAAIAYGLTSGGYNADTISITPLAMRIVRPTTEGDDTAAKREAFLKPRVMREFLQKYDRAPIPRDDIARNVLMELGVPTDRAGEVLSLIVDGAKELGFLQQIKDRTYVDLSSAKAPVESKVTEIASTTTSEDGSLGIVEEGAQPITPTPSFATRLPEETARLRRVFISHGKNRALIEPIKKLLSFGEFVPIAEIENPTVSQPVPTKVMTGMRSCGAAIIHVEDERRISDDKGEAHVILNENVLIEIGAAMALYGDRFILVVKEGVTLPSNLQGLLQLRYKGDTLDVNETVALMEAMKDMKGRSLPPTG